MAFVEHIKCLDFRATKLITPLFIYLIVGRSQVEESFLNEYGLFLVSPRSLSVWCNQSSWHCGKVGYIPVLSIIRVWRRIQKEINIQ